MNTIDQIYDVITRLTALDFATTKLNEIEKKEGELFFQYLNDVYGSSSEDLEALKQKALHSFIDEFNKCVSIYSGFLNNGSVFVLDKENKLVLALYEQDKDHHKMIVHYNPHNVDLFELSCRNDYFFTQLNNGLYDLSKDKDRLIKECNDL